jgi:mRNA interferase RelE/StbE
MYEILLARPAERDLKHLPPEIFDRILQKIRALADEPRPPGCRKLSGSEREYRIRIGEHRVLYEVFDEAREVRI